MPLLGGAMHIAHASPLDSKAVGEAIMKSSKILGTEADNENVLRKLVNGPNLRGPTEGFTPFAGTGHKLGKSFADIGYGAVKKQLSGFASGFTGGLKGIVSNSFSN